MDNYKEIVTKAIIGKSKKNSKDSLEIKSENTPSTVLGCWIINHKFNGFSKGNDVTINGSYDINVWYSYDNDTKTAVSNETFNYIDNLKVNLHDNLLDGKEVIVRSLKQPSVSDVKIDGDIIKLNVEKEMACEVVGNTKIKINALALDDDYEDITVSDDINNIDEDYIK